MDVRINKLKKLYKKNPLKADNALKKRIQESMNDKEVEKFILDFCSIADMYDWSWYASHINSETVHNTIADFTFRIVKSFILDKDFIRYTASGRIIVFFLDYDKFKSEKIVEVGYATSL